MESRCILNTRGHDVADEGSRDSTTQPRFIPESGSTFVCIARHMSSTFTQLYGVFGQTSANSILSAFVWYAYCSTYEYAVYIENARTMMGLMWPMS